jgi:hypothetical protein
MGGKRSQKTAGSRRLPETILQTDQRGAGQSHQETCLTHYNRELWQIPSGKKIAMPSWLDMIVKLQSLFTMYHETGSASSTHFEPLLPEKKSKGRLTTLAHQRATQAGMKDLTTKPKGQSRRHQKVRGRQLCHWQVTARKH